MQENAFYSIVEPLSYSITDEICWEYFKWNIYDLIELELSFIAWEIRVTCDRIFEFLKVWSFKFFSIQGSDCVKKVRGFAYFDWKSALPTLFLYNFNFQRPLVPNILVIMLSCSFKRTMVKYVRFNWDQSSFTVVKINIYK